MTFQINRSLLEGGLEEAMKATINSLDLKLKEGNVTDSRAAYEECLRVQEVARIFLVSTDKYETILAHKDGEIYRLLGHT